MKKILFLILIVSVFIFNCKEKPKPEFFIDQDTKDFCVFKVGSWWIYQEELSAEKDCVWVVESNEKKIDSDHVRNVRNGIQMVLFSTLWSKQNVQITCWGGGGTGDPETNRFEERLSFPLALNDYTFYSVLDTTIFFEPFSGYQIRLFNKLIEYNLNGKQFEDVRIFSVNKGLHQYWQKKIYWAKYIGKIRYERGDGTIWNLINYKVEQ